MSPKIFVHAIVTEPGYVDKTAVEGMLAGASQVYSPIGLTFELASLEETSDPVLSKDQGSSVKTSGPPMDIELDRTARAARYPGRVVVFFRPVKNDTDYKAANYSSSWGEFVVMEGTSGTGFAHEVGHYLHLGHTFNEDAMNQLYAKNTAEGYEAAKKLAAQLIQSAGGLQIFDGDFPAVKDTPPDPGPPLFQPSGYTVGGSAVNPNEHCSGTLSLVVGSKTYVLAPDRANIMSYFMGCPGNHNISPDQGKIVQAAFTSGNRRHLVKGASPESPAVAVTPAGHIHLFARGDDRNIRHSFWNGTAWSGWIADVTSGTFMSGLAAVAPSDKILHAFALGDDREVWHSTRTGQTWSGWAKRGGGTFQP
jgi:hypothetical protein